MKNNLVLDAGAGSQFDNVAKYAQEMAIRNQMNVEFDFNGVKCVVAPYTNLEWLWRDYSNAHRMNWGTIGPHCSEKYSPQVQAAIDRLNAEAEIKAEQQRKEYEAKRNKAKSEFDAKIEGVEFEAIDKQAWLDWRAKNTDGYGNAIMEFAEGWAKLMQIEIGKGFTVSQCAEDLSFKFDWLGLSGAQYHMAISALSKSWVHGEELLKWHKSKR